MNENLEHLMYLAGLTAQGCWDEMDEYDRAAIAKFAELIVGECLEVVEKQLGGGNGDGVEWDRAIDFTYEDMKTHFGVE